LLPILTICNIGSTAQGGIPMTVNKMNQRGRNFISCPLWDKIRK